MNLIGTTLDPNDGASCEFELKEIFSIYENDDVLYLWGNIPLVLSSVTSPELTAAQARITELETALSKIVANDDKWKGWSDEQKSKVQWWHQGSIARAALGIKETR